MAQANSPVKSLLSTARTVPRNVWAVTFTSLLTDISSEMVLNLLPLFLANVLGVKTNVIGLIEGIAESTASLLKLISGWYSDRLGKRKALTVMGYSLSACVKPFLYFAASWPGVLAVRFVDRVGKGVRTAPRDALIADSIAPEHRGAAFGLHRAGDTLGAFLGLGIALLIVLGSQSNAVELSRDTFQTVTLISIIPALLAVVVLVIGVREAPTSIVRTQAPRLSLRGLPRPFLRFLFILLLFALGNSADAFLILRAQTLGLSVTGVLGMLMAFNLVYALFSGPAGVLSDRIGRRRLILLGWTAYGAIYLGFSAAAQPWHVWLLYAAYGLYYAAFEGSAKAYIADLVPAEQRGTAYGLYSAALAFAALPASLIAGILWQGIGSWPGWGPAAPFMFGAVLAAAAALLFTFWHTTS